MIAPLCPLASSWFRGYLLKLFFSSFHKMSISRSLTTDVTLSLPLYILLSNSQSKPRGNVDVSIWLIHKTFKT